MPDVGDEFVGAYLRVVQQCDFVQYNVPTREKQGEIDVIGINLASRTAYICEVATHLVTGLNYVKNAQPDNVNRISKKFKSDIKYAQKPFDNAICNHDGDLASRLSRRWMEAR